MDENLVKRLRARADREDDYYEHGGDVIREAADAIEELSERVEELEAAQEISPEAKHFVDTKADNIIEGLQDLLASVKERRWIPVTERLPESVDDDVLVTDGEGCAVGYWRPDAQAWDSTDFGWLENRSEPPCGIHTVTHWMPLPPLPEQTKEEAE